MLFVTATFLGATLLFLVEPMVTKMLLPLLGGTPAVWNTAMVFFQAALLGGYAFAHISLTRLGTKRQPVVQVFFLLAPLFLLPIAVPAGWHPPTEGSPAAWTLLALAVMVGAPFFMLSTAGPTLQRWFSATTHPRAHDPYFLYAAGNIGSLLALIGYPIVIEPTLSLTAQSRIWSALYLAFVLCCAACAVVLRRQHAADVPDAEVAARAPAPTTITNRTRLRWIYLAAIPSALMLGVTRHIATDVASMPLLWVIPLSLYLVTFIVAFGRRPGTPVRISGRILKLLVVPLAVSFFGLVASLWLVFALHLTVFFCAAMVAHGRLSAERPEPAKLTEFYLLLSTGGMVGGILTALVAPVVFTTVVEYPLAIVLALTVLPFTAFDSSSAGTDASSSPLSRPLLTVAGRAITVRTVLLGLPVVALAIASVVIRGWGTQSSLTLSIIIGGIVAAGAFALARTPITYAMSIAVLLLVAVLVPAHPTAYGARTFFGVHRVYEDATATTRHVLLNGTTVHGMEDYTGANAFQPTTYYHRTGPIGQFFEQRQTSTGPQQIALVGLGSGALAAYGRAGDRFTYYEIDQAVIDIARNRDLFTFVPDSKAAIDFKLGDGRLELEATDQRYDVMVVDAFSGDAIPVHLITNEALALYTQRITDHGIIAFHISNRYFDFAPVLERLAHEQGLVGYLQDNPPTPAEEEQGKLDATWVLLARSPADLGALATDTRWTRMGDGADAPLWTDTYSDLLHVFRWSGS